MKKRSLLFIMLFSFFMYLPNALAVNIHSCSGSIEGAIIDAKIPDTVSTVITVIKIAVPVILVIFGMLDLFKGIMQQKEDEIKKGQQIFIKRLISGALIFFVFTIVQFIIGFVSDSDDRTDMMSCVQCFVNGDCTYEKNADGSCPKNTVLSENGTHCVEQ